MDIMKLTRDCLIEIFKNLDIEDKLNVSQVCSLWQDASHHSWTNIKVLNMTPAAVYLQRRNFDFDELMTVLEKSGPHLETLIMDVTNDIRPMEVITERCTSLKTLRLSFQTEDAAVISKTCDLLLNLITHQTELTCLHLSNIPSIFQWFCLNQVPQTNKITNVTLSSSYNYNYPNGNRIHWMLWRYQQLKSVKFDGFEFRGEDLQGLDNSQFVSEVYLKYGQTDEHFGRRLAQVKSLTHVKLRSMTGFDNTHLSLIGSCCQNIQEISLCNVQGTTITDAGFRPISELCHLRSITLGYLKIAANDAIGNLRGLQKLHIDSCEYISTEAIVNAVANSPDLEELFIVDLAVSGEFVGTVDAIVRSQSTRRQVLLLKVPCSIEQWVLTHQQENQFSPLIDIHCE